jgi:rhodanese-related sulfurtransferase
MWRSRINNGLVWTLTDKKTPVLLYCNSGQRSGMAKRLLEAYGFQLVHNMGSYNRLYECELAG